MTAVGGAGLELPEDDTTVCNVVGADGLECGQEFPDDLAWQEHFEDTHLGDDEDDG